MWLVKRVEERPVSFDFTGSGQGIRRDRSLLGDDVVLVNMVGGSELADDDSFQVEICEHCGYQQCESGGWLRLRRVGAGVAWVPWISDPLSTRETDSEHAAPGFSKGLGFPLFLGSALASLNAFAPRLAFSSETPILSLGEALFVVATESPAAALSIENGKIEIRRDRLVAVDSGELESLVDELEGIAGAACGDVSPVQVVEECRPLTFLLDPPELPDWQPLAISPDSSLVLHLGGGVGVKSGPSAA